MKGMVISCKISVGVRYMAVCVISTDCLTTDDSGKNEYED